MEYAIGAILGFMSGMILVSFWTYPIVERLREENGKLKIDLQYAGRD